MKKRDESSKRQTDLQGKTFVEAARALGADESVEAFDKVLRRIAKAPPPKSVQKRKLQSGRGRVSSDRPNRSRRRYSVLRARSGPHRYGDR